MSDKMKLPSLRAYAAAKSKALVRGSSSPKTGVVNVNSISPFKSGKSAAVSFSARSSALRFAHPIDSALIKTLDNPIINEVLNKLVQAGIDASHGLTLAEGVNVSEKNYGEFYELIKECAATLGIPVPHVVISNSIKGINACTAGTDQFAFIKISNILPLVMRGDELRFVIGHECGHLALGHVLYHTAANIVNTAGKLIPLIGNVVADGIAYPLKAWSRRSEISADRAGLICCGDFDTAKRALLRLEMGFINIDNLDVDEYISNSERLLKKLSFGDLKELARDHPIIPKRLKALKLFHRSKLCAEVMNLPDVPGERRLSDVELKNAVERIVEVI